MLFLPLSSKLRVLSDAECIKRVIDAHIAQDDSAIQEVILP